MRSEQRPRVRERIRVDADPGSVDELLGEQTLGPHGRERIGGEKRVAPEMTGVAHAVQEHDVRQIGEARAAVEWVGSGCQLLHERCRVVHRRLLVRDARRA